MFLQSDDAVSILNPDRDVEQQEQSPDELETLSHLTGRWKEAYDNQQWYAAKWDLFRRVLKGEQLLWRNVQTGEVMSNIGRANEKRLYSINNQISPASAAFVGKHASSVPQATAIMATSDSEEISGARVATAFCDFLTRTEDIQLKWVDAVDQWTWCGTSVFQLGWNHFHGETYAWCETCQYTYPKEYEGQPCPSCEAQLTEAMASHQEADLANMQASVQHGAPLPEDQGQGVLDAVQQQIPILKKVQEGDKEIKLLDSRNFFPQPGIFKMEDMQWCIVRHVLPFQKIREMFPEKAKYISPDMSGIYADPFMPLNQMEGTTGRSTYLRDFTQMFEYHEAPSTNYPSGRVIHFTESVLLSDVDGFYEKFKQLPFFVTGWLKRPGEFWFEPPIEQAWTRQKELNTLETQLREYVELLTRMKMLNPMGSRIDVDEITATTGQVLKYNHLTGAKPEFISPPEMPQAVFQRRADLMQDIRLQFGVTDQEMAINQTQTNGREMAILNSEADQKLKPIMVRNFAAIKKLYLCALQLMQTNFDPERQIRVYGQESFGEVYTAKELNFYPGFDIVLEIEDGLAKNQQQRWQQAMEQLQAGVYMDPTTGQNDMVRFMKDAKLKTPGMGVNDSASEYAAAQELIRKIKNGEDTSPMPYDDVKIFGEVLAKWLRTKGRSTQEPYAARITGAWVFYSTMAMQQANPGQPGAPPDMSWVQGQQGQQGSMPGQMLSAAGGSPNGFSPGQNVNQSAQGMTANADQQGEAAAKQSLSRENQLL